MCIIITCSYRTISIEVAFIITGILPIDTNKDAMNRVYSRTASGQLNLNYRPKIKTEVQIVSKSRWKAR